MHVNLCSTADNSTQLIPFLKNAETMKYNGEYNDIEVFLHFEPDKGHNGIDCLKDYSGEVLLVEINYNKDDN